MGLFGFISKLFSKTEQSHPIETIEIDVSQLGSWFDNKVNAMFTELSGEIRGIFRQMDEEIAEAEKNMQILENARLMNANIPEKVRILLDGNREAHLQKNRMFLQNLVIPEKISYKSTSEFCDQFQKNLAGLAKQTTKSYQILQEFFADESGEVSQNLKNLDTHVKQVREILNNKSTDVNLVEDIKEMIKQAEHRISLKRDTLKAMDDENSKVNFLLSEKRKVANMIMQLKQGPEYAKLENYTSRKEAVKNDIFMHKEELHRLFLPLEKALKKFEHMNIRDSKLINFYLGNELDALRLDKELKITDVLSELREKINDGSISLNEKQKEKAVEAISQITTSRLSSVLGSVSRKKENIEGLDRQIRLINIGNDLDDLQYKLKHIEDKIRKAQLNTQKIEKGVDKVDIVGLKLDIQQKIKELFGVNLVVFQEYEQKKAEEGEGDVTGGGEDDQEKEEGAPDIEREGEGQPDKIIE